MNWEKLKNANTLIQIILGMVLLSSAIGLTNEIIKKGINLKFPIWITLLLIIVAFFFGLLTGKRKKGDSKIDKVNSKNLKLKFNDFPEKLSWHLGINKKTNVRPDINIGKDGIYGFYWKIEEKDPYYLDYSLLITNNFFSNLFLVVQNIKTCTIYAKVKMKSKNGELEKRGWIAIKEGDTIAKPYGSGNEEWTFYTLPIKINNNWKEFEINLPDAVNQTFGKEGWNYYRITDLRIRGSINIAEIELK
jgi:hypothetical protein